MNIDNDGFDFEQWCDRWLETVDYEQVTVGVHSVPTDKHPSGQALRVFNASYEGDRMCSTRGVWLDQWSCEEVAL